MSKRWLSLTMVGMVAAVAGFGQVGNALGADTKADAPVVISDPANDPTKPAPGSVRWFMPSHNRYLEQTKNKKIDLCFLGDSITQMWPAALFEKYYGKDGAVNFGIGGDKTQNVLWRLENGELAGTSPRVIVLLIGTNNLGVNSPEEIAAGIAAVVKSLRTKFPKTRILLLGIFPKKDNVGEKIAATNAIAAKLDDGKMVRYLDIGSAFLDKERKLRDDVMSDQVHLNRKGYEIWGAAIRPLLAKMMMGK